MVYKYHGIFGRVQFMAIQEVSEKIQGLQQMIKGRPDNVRIRWVIVTLIELLRKRDIFRYI